MADLVDSDLTRGPQVKWYLGGEYVQETKTVSTTEAAAGGFALATSATADYGLLVGTVNGVVTSFTGHIGATGASAASESTGITFVKYSGITAGDAVVLKYVDVHTTTLTHVASCQDVKKGTKAGSKKTALHGQEYKVTAIGTQESTADLVALDYNKTFKAAVLGDLAANSPASGENTLTNAFSGFHTIGCLVGKKTENAVVTKKWALINCKPNDLTTDFPTEDYYKDSIKMDMDFFIEWEA